MNSSFRRWGHLAIALASVLKAQAEVVVYPAPAGTPVSTKYTVTVGGKTVPVFRFPTVLNQTPAYFAACDIAGPVKVAVVANFLTPAAVTNMTVHPRALALPAQHKQNRLSFQVTQPANLTILVNGQFDNQPLHLFLNPPAEPPPQDAIVFGPGKHVLSYDKPITLTNGQTLYLAGGAWVEGIVRANNAQRIRVTGRGVLSQSVPQGVDYQGDKNVAPSGIAFTGCQDVTVDGIILTRTVGGWCSLVTNCDRVTVSNFHVVASVMPSTDGFNPCNSRDVIIERSFFRTADDCIAIKGRTGPSVVTHPHIEPATQPAVERITIRGCVFWNDRNNVVVIGAETRAQHITGIRMEDCDILFQNKYFRDLGALSIVALHATEIRDVTFDNIRLEHIENQLFCFRFTDNIYNIPGNLSFPGTIANVAIRNIHVTHQRGGPRSEFTGWSADKRVTGVSVTGLRYVAQLIGDEAAMGLKRNSFTDPVRFE